MAGPVDLRFNWAVEPTPGPVDLRFGAPDVAPANVEGALLAALDTAVPVATFAAVGSTVLDLPDAAGVGLGARQQQMQRTTSGLAAAQQHMQPAHIAARAEQQAAAPLQVGARIAQQHMQPAHIPASAPHRHAAHGHASTRAPHAESIRARRAAREAHQHALALSHGARFAAAETLKHRRRAIVRHQHGQAVRIMARGGHRHGLATARGLGADHQQMIPLPVGWWQATYPWPPAPVPELPAVLRFCRLADDTHTLVFGCRPAAPPAGIVVPILEYYLVIYDFTLVRADTGQPVPVDDFSASIDADSWAWSWSANLHASLLHLVAPAAPGDYVELIATINGTAIRVIVERLARDRRFAKSQLKISGRGRAAWLADPHSLTETRLNASPLTARQLLDDALTLNGVPIGWDVDWRIEDWLVPAGAWSHTGTYIAAATRIAEAGGAYVQGHNTAQALIILPRYPVAPWAWAAATPDIELPDAPVEVESIEWADKPDYNAIWIAGGEGGRLDRIRKTGTAADVVMQTIVDPLATAPEMTRQRGLAALGDTGRQAIITLRLPVLPETGIIQPGKLVRYTENGTPRLGLSRGVSIDTKFPETWQTVRLETHV